MQWALRQLASTDNIVKSYAEFAHNRLKTTAWCHMVIRTGTNLFYSSKIEGFGWTSEFTAARSGNNDVTRHYENHLIMQLTYLKRLCTWTIAPCHPAWPDNSCIVSSDLHKRNFLNKCGMLKTALRLVSYRKEGKRGHSQLVFIHLQAVWIVVTHGCIRNQQYIIPAVQITQGLIHTISILPVVIMLW